MDEGTNPRDTQFQGFAKVLWDELVRANGYGYIDVNEDDDGIDPTNYRQIIARRAYDLLYHASIAINNTQVKQLGMSLHPNAMMRDIPDLTDLPKEQER